MDKQQMRIKNVVEINCLKLAAFRKIYNQDFKKERRKKKETRQSIGNRIDDIRVERKY